MNYNILICVFYLLSVSYKCDGYGHGKPQGLLGGLLSGAQEIGSKVQEVIKDFSNGNIDINLGGQIYGQHQPGYQKPPPFNGNNGGNNPQTETIIVVVEEEPHQNDGQGQRPPQLYGHNPQYNNNYKPDFLNKPGYNGYNSHYNGQGQWNTNNNYYRPPPPHHHHPHHHHHHRPGYGYNPGNNYNGNNIPNNFGCNEDCSPNCETQTQNTNPIDVIPAPNNGNDGNSNPTGNNGNQNPNHDQAGTNGDYGNPDNPKPSEQPVQNHVTPSPVVTTNEPNYGSIYDPTKEDSDKKPNYSNNDKNVSGNDKQKPDNDDRPTFIPLNPNQYHYGGDKIEINAPKRETNENKKPNEDDDSESYPIDIRFGD